MQEDRNALYFKQKSTEIIQFRTSKALKEDISEICQTAKISVAELLKYYLHDVATGTDRHFECCKTCGEALILKELRDSLVTVITCSRGHENNFGESSINEPLPKKGIVSVWKKSNT